MEKLIRQHMDIDEMEVGFMPGCGIVNAISVLRQLTGEIFRKKKENFYFTFVDLQKIFDQVAWDVVRWASRRLGAEKWLVKIIQLMYRNGQSYVRIKQTFNDDFLVQVGLNQGSVFNVDKN